MFGILIIQFLCYFYWFDQGNLLVECNMCWVVLFIVCMMVVEIVGGWLFNFMVLFVDGWYMSFYVLVLGFVVFVYGVVWCYVNDLCFSFGMWKIEVFGSYISVLLFLLVVGLMFY